MGTADHETTEHGTTGLRDYETTRPRDYGTTRPRDYETTGPQDYETTRPRDHETNFGRLCALALSRGEVKHIILKTGTAFGEDLDDADSRLENLKRELAKDHGVKMEWSRSEKLHDREVVFSNGWIVKVGRGLDIYYPPESWASVGASNYNLRKCRQTKVDVLRRET